MTDWKIGQILNVRINNNFLLNVERIEEKKINKRLNIKNFKFKVNIDSRKNKENNLILNDTNIDYVREGLINIFENVKRSFKKMKVLRTFKLICLLMDCKNCI